MRTRGPVECEHCGQANAPDARFCDRCGTALTPSRSGNGAFLLGFALMAIAWTIYPDSRHPPSDIPVRSGEAAIRPVSATTSPALAWSAEARAMIADDACEPERSASDDGNRRSAAVSQRCGDRLLPLPRLAAIR